MNEAAFRAEQQKALQSAQTGAIDAEAVITGMRLTDGSWHVLSRYGDPVWTLPDSLFAASVMDSKKKLNFARVPTIYRETLRACMARYILLGAEGRVRPRGGTVFYFFENTLRFLAWLDDKGGRPLRAVTPLVAQQYVEVRRGEKLSASTLRLRFSAIETLHILSQHTADPMPHPWPESSASHLAGLTGDNNPHRQESKTAIIPDEVLRTLFQAAVDELDRADEIIGLQAQIAGWQAQGRSPRFIASRLAKQGWTSGEINDAARHLQTACMVIILVTSGIRVSELCSLVNGCAYTKQDDEGDTYHWLRGVAYKTGTGPCEWLVTELTHRAIAVAECLARPLQARLEQSMSALGRDNPSDPEVTRRREHTHRLFLGMHIGGRRGRTLSGDHVVRRLNAFAAGCGLDWRFAPHQFRRTFAVYAAHSAFGDLRYLRDHYKHWSLDMTSLYAMNREQDAELYDEVGSAALDIKHDLLEHWLQPDAILTGGAAEPIRTFRAKNEELVTKESRAEMAKTLSPLVHVRATGVAWCTADTGGCNGGQGVEKTRCGDCANAVIDEAHKPVWQGIYKQQLELLELTDIGPGGAERVERDIARCKAVLAELGAAEQDLSDTEAATEERTANDDI